MKIYRYLRTFWIASALSLALSLASLLNIVSTAFDLALNAAGIALGVVVVWALGKMSGESARLSRAFWCQCFNVALSAIATVLSFLPSDSEMLSVLLALMVSAAGLFSIVSDFQLYWALDERVVTCGYAFPARRIRWCFYLPLVGVLLSSAVETAQIASQLEAGQEVTELAFSSAGTAVLFLCQLGALLLLARYCIAVERFEADNVQ